MVSKFDSHLIGFFIGVHNIHLKINYYPRIFFSVKGTGPVMWGPVFLLVCSKSFRFGLSVPATWLS